jgi:hypothetical protein
LNNVTITPADNGYIVSDGQRLMVATTLQEALQMIVSALEREATVFVAFSQSNASH